MNVAGSEAYINVANKLLREGGKRVNFELDGEM
jgi:hypothetical protein